MTTRISLSLRDKGGGRWPMPTFPGSLRRYHEHNMVRRMVLKQFTSRVTRISALSTAITRSVDVLQPLPLPRLYMRPVRALELHELFAGGSEQRGFLFGHLVNREAATILVQRTRWAGDLAHEIKVTLVPHQQLWPIPNA